MRTIRAIRLTNIIGKLLSLLGGAEFEMHVKAINSDLRARANREVNRELHRAFCDLGPPPGSVANR